MPPKNILKRVLESLRDAQNRVTIRPNVVKTLNQAESYFVFVLCFCQQEGVGLGLWVGKRIV